MGIFSEKISEVARSIVPVVLLVVALCLTVVPVEPAVLIRFLIGAVIVLVGLALFLLGIDISIQKIGEYMSQAIATSKSLFAITILGFLIGFLVTIAEPDLLILTKQVENASGATLSSNVLVYIVSFGVGLLVFLGILRSFLNKRYKIFICIIYLVIGFLGFFVSEEFLAISFDASGATTGALTTPFILAISAGIASLKGGKTSEEDSFGLVGVMSTGPILALMLLSIITQQKQIQGVVEEFVVQEGIFMPIILQFPHIFIESLLAITPIVVLFLIYNAIQFKISFSECTVIFRGLIYTVLGLTLFLSGVNAGFMDMGRLLGVFIAGENGFLLLMVGLLLGFIVVLAEPAVHILGQQIERVTTGHIPVKLISATLSIGVGLAVAFSMLRIMVPSVKLWYFLVFGFGLSIILSFFCDPVFVGIAYDAGGVASGPITATFILAFAQGAADTIPTANVLVDGFGVIAMVAMSPILSLMVLGVLFKIKANRHKGQRGRLRLATQKLLETGIYSRWETLAVSVDRKLADDVIVLARMAGARGATIIRGLASGNENKLFSLAIGEEKEVVIMIIEPQIRSDVINSIDAELDLGESAYFVLPTIAHGI
ncbi:MAG: DUF1538 domain-containing protein [Spirochaetaceae bacterium]|nr:DUF1538 domain-containing protein [Spirochaetaceae bacterium]